MSITGRDANGPPCNPKELDEQILDRIKHLKRRPCSEKFGDEYCRGGEDCFVSDDDKYHIHRSFHYTWVTPADERRAKRNYKLDLLAAFYTSRLAEDAQDGTDFDSKVIAAIEALKT